MDRYRVRYGAIKPKYETFATVALAIKYLRKNKTLNEDNSILEENFEGEWDEWLDDDAQTIHDHIYMYGSKSPYMKEKKKVDDNEEFDPVGAVSFSNIVEDDDDDDDDEEEEIDDEEEEEVDEEEIENRYMNAIGAGRGSGNVDTDDDDDDDDDDLDGDGENS